MRKTLSLMRSAEMAALTSLWGSRGDVGAEALGHAITSSKARQIGNWPSPASSPSQNFAITYVKDTEQLQCARKIDG
jgi:hypothetical protein